MDLLKVIWDLDPVIFSLGPFELRYYSLLFVTGLYPLGYWIVKQFYKREGASVELLEPLLYALFLGTLIGARLGHCLFYDPWYYLASPVEILKVWEGGLASHGGAIGCVIAIWWYAKKYGPKNGFNFWWVVDRVVIATCFAGCLIRLGNLCNSEIYGNPTDLPWGFVFVNRGEVLPKHPTQLYEALSYFLLGLSLLWVYYKKLDKIYRGSIFGIFFIVLWGMRFLIEFVKEPQEAFEQGMVLNMGQWLSVPFIIAGVVILIVSLQKKVPARLTKRDARSGRA